ncbi:ImmA/IrrE family metallo-endopeptidase [Mycobacteroides abscessus subsp. abscessus]|uniref:ImmA/IrrE family metallo-endopeptidase n=1 Tax=Mycobacteroides abscessus TaxID=36809 RepID=UPI0039F10B2F
MLTSPHTQEANLTNAAISEYAELVGRKNDIYADGRANIEEFVARLGGEIVFADGGESLHVRKPGNFTVFLPQFTSSSRDRFTLAHELGHYFLHYRYVGKTGEMSFGRGARNRAETEANVFASTLLMPADEFRAHWERHGGDTWRVAQHFGVSPAAVGIRAQVLRLTT